MVEVTNEASAAVWLETQRHQTKVWFAARCALRVLPLVGTRQDATESGIALAALRSVLFATAAAHSIDEVQRVADRVTELTAFGGHPQYGAANTAFRSCFSCFRSINLNSSTNSERRANIRRTGSAASCAKLAADSTDIAHSFDLGDAYTGDGADISLSAIRHMMAIDAASPETWGPLWDTSDQPPWPSAAWKDLKAQWQVDAADWSFWIKWYEAVRDGTWTNWDLIFRIATTLTDEDWDKGAAHVAGEIEKIRRAQREEAESVAPEHVDPNNVVSLFDRAPIIRTSMASLSETISLRVDAFTRMQRPNEAIPFFDALKSLPDTADRIARILEEGRSAPNSEKALALEVGRLRAEVEHLKAALQSAHKELEILRKKPWYRSASILLPVAVVSSIATGLWTLSGDDKSLEHRWNKLVEDYEFLSIKIWPEPEDRINEPLRFELPENDET